MIVGIALVVDELRKGERLIMRYPPTVGSFANSSSSGRDALSAFHEEYMRTSPANFAKLFRAKPALHNKVVEITIEDLHYISFPCSCVEDSSDSFNNNVIYTEDSITLFNVIVTVVQQNAMKKYSSVDGDCATDLLGARDPIVDALGLASSHNLAVPIKSICRVVESFSKALLHEERKSRYVSRQVSQMLKITENSGNGIGGNIGNNINSSSSIEGSSSDNNSSIGALGDSMGSSESGGSSSIITNDSKKYDLLIETMEHLLLKCSLANEMKSIYHGLVGGHSVNLSVNSILTINIKLCNSYMSRQQKSLSLKSSRLKSLASSSKLASLGGSKLDAENIGASYMSNKYNYRPYHSLLLLADYEAILMLLNNLSNNSIPSNVSTSSAVINDVRFDSSSNAGSTSPFKSYSTPSTPPGSLATNNDFSSGGEALGTRGLSYSSTNSNASMLSTLTSITHPRIHDVLSNCKLNLSFVELSAMLDEPLDEIYRIVNHLEHWGLCKVITTITSNLVYVVSPSLAPSQGLSGLSKEGFKQNGGIKGINCFRRSGPQALSHKSPSEANLQDAALADHTGDSGLEEDNSYLLLSRLFSSAFGLMKGINISEIDFFYASSAADAKHENKTDSDRFLFAILSFFDGKSTVSEIVNKKLPICLKPYFVDILVWLLRRDLIVDMKEYWRFDINEMEKYACLPSLSTSTSTVSIDFSINNSKSSNNIDVTSGSGIISNSNSNNKLNSENIDNIMGSQTGISLHCSQCSVSVAQLNNSTDPASIQAPAISNSNLDKFLGSSCLLCRLYYIVKTSKDDCISLNDLIVRTGKAEDDLKEGLKKFHFIESFYMIE